MDMDPLTALMVHLELDLCLRRVEIMRLRVRDIHADRMDVLGKGRMGGKPRTISLVPGESQAVIGRYMELRRQLENQTEGPQTDKLVVYFARGQLRPLKRSAHDNRLKALQVESGIKFLGHLTLRRTGGRLMWLAKVPFETIASVMGHESTEMTLRYIGVNLGDQCRAFEAVENLHVQLRENGRNCTFCDRACRLSGPRGMTEHETDWLDARRRKIGLESHLWKAPGKPAQTPSRYFI